MMKQKMNEGKESLLSRKESNKKMGIHADDECDSDSLERHQTRYKRKKN